MKQYIRFRFEENDTKRHKWVLKELNLKNSTICKDLGFTHTIFNDWIAGRRTISYEDYEKYFKYLLDKSWGKKE